ncbi:MAG: hypothetical protein VB997_10340, partial [Opitutales bacterium]
LCAVSDDHKLVFSTVDKPWLYDLSKDPDEMDNRFERPEYAEVVRRLTQGLEAYCKKYKDPYGAVPGIKSSMLATMKRE